MADDPDAPIDFPLLTEFEGKVTSALERIEKHVLTLQLRVEELALSLQQPASTQATPPKPEGSANKSAGSKRKPAEKGR